MIEPTKLFDNLYFVGQNAVSAHALTTDAGIVLFDTLDNEDEARNILIPNLVKLGLDPKKIVYIVITHAHGDHYGGASYLQKTYGAKVISSKIDWQGMRDAEARPDGPFAGLKPPDRDIEIEDGQVVDVGSTRLQFYVTPGHTPGTVSTIFKVTENAVPHTVGYFGGTGGGRQPADLRAQITSLERWRKLTETAGVDVLIANHSLHDRAIETTKYFVTARRGIRILISWERQRISATCSCRKSVPASIYLARFGFTE